MSQHVPGRVRATLLPSILLLFALLPAPGVARGAGNPSAAPAVLLRNRYVEVTIRDGVLSGLRAAPDGSGKMGAARFTCELRPEGWEATPRTRVTGAVSTTTVAPLQMYQPQPIRIDGGQGARADKLTPGGSFAQTFRVPEGSVFDAVAARVPTWQTKTSGATLRLYRGDVLLAERRIASAADNAWQEVRPAAPQGPGEYRLEMTDPVGEIGWWGRADDVYPGGQAYNGGVPAAGDRTLRVDARAEAGEGALHVSLKGSVLTLDAEARSRPAPGTAPVLTWQWRTTWTKAGYDVSPAAGVVFSRFFSDNQRYMPVEQLKRRDNGGLAFSGCRWIELEGTQGADLRLAAQAGGALGLQWEMAADTMTLRVGTPQRPYAPAGAGPALRSRLTVAVQPRADSAPPGLPRFEFADRRLAEDANRFWWGKAFTYPAPALPAAWFEWMALMRCWYGGPARDGEMRQLETYPITAEGYVHTWRQDVGWPLRPAPGTDTRHGDTNARYILACWRFWRWTGDRAFLERQADRLRRAMRYQLVNLRGSEGAVVTESRDVQGRHGDQGNNYWDILPFGHLDAYANAVFYASLEAMREMEVALGDGHGGWDYAALRERVRRRYDALFWDDDKGRYIGCVDANGGRHDYGFTFVNIEALYYGLGDAAKAKRIYRWMETEPTSSGTADTYTRFVFAPRATTIHNPRWGAEGAAEKGTAPPWWVSWWKGTPYGDQCQDGGAILYLSYYDLMVRSRYFGAQNAWKRWEQILGRYRLPDRLSGGDPLFTGEKPQQEDAGQVGTDYPFPESGLVPCFLFYGVIGAEATAEGLRVTPRLPNAVPFAEVRDVNWRGARLTLRATRTGVEFRGTTRSGRSFRRVERLDRRGGALLTDVALR